MNGAEWLILILIGCVLYLVFKPKNKATHKGEHFVFDEVPDGKYIVRFKEEKAVPKEFILGVFEVSRGEHAGKRVPVKFKSAKAKKVMREYSQDWLEHLAYDEDDNRAANLMDEIDNTTSNPDVVELIVNVKNNAVTTIPEFAGDFDKIERLIKKIEKKK